MWYFWLVVDKLIFPLTDLEKHEFVEGVIPLHEDNVVGQGSTQVPVAVVGVPPHTAASAPLCVWNFCSVVKLPVKRLHQNLYTSSVHTQVIQDCLLPREPLYNYHLFKRKSIFCNYIFHPLIFYQFHCCVWYYHFLGFKLN